MRKKQCESYWEKTLYESVEKVSETMRMRKNEALVKSREKEQR